MKQTEMILKHMIQFGSINPIEALQEYGCFRLAARINELRENYHIDTTMVKRTNRFGKKIQFAEYKLSPYGEN